MKSIPLASIPAAALGIEVAAHEHGPQYGWFFRLVAPAPFLDWHGPEDTHELAQARALKHLLFLARSGSDAIDGIDVAFRPTQQPTNAPTNAPTDDEPVYGVAL